MIDPPSKTRHKRRPFDRKQFFLLAVQVFAVLAGSAVVALLLLSQRSWPLEQLTYTGMVLVCIVAVVLTRFHLRHTPLKGVQAPIAERIVWVTGILGIAGVQLINRSLGQRELLGVGFLLMGPMVAQAMIVSALIGPAVSLFALTATTLLLGVAKDVPVEMLAAAWLAGAVGAHAVNPLKQRSDLIRATTVQILAQGVIACCVAAVSTSEAPLVAESAGWAAVAAILATSIFWLLVVVLEKIFGIISDWSLLELCSPDHPLIHELCMRSPGTYAHSVMVGNLAENAARDIGANPLLCRAMAYYHDVGKLTRPSFFVENQVGENVHDEMSPTLSAVVIAAHVKDGLELAKQYKLPKVLRDGIAEHHGTTLITYFYNRALEQGEDKSGSMEQFFRYEGPKPQTRETAILCLADGVEAASRTVPRGASEELEVLIMKIIEDRRADGQLDECDLTLRELQQIHLSFLRSLGAIRHERIVYPEGAANEAVADASYLDLEQLPATNPPQAHPRGD